MSNTTTAMSAHGCACPGGVGQSSGCKYANWNFVQVVLQSAESSEMSTDESVRTIQGEETGYAKSEADTSTSSSSSSSSEEEERDRLFTSASYTNLQLRQQEEYDVQSLSEDCGDPLGESDNSSGTEVMAVFPGVMAATFAMQDSDNSSLNSSEDSSERPDSELSMKDYWACVQCREKNNNPLFRFCERCFKERKEFFVPRPFRVKTRNDLQRERKERQQNKRMRTKNREVSDLSSEEEGVAAKKAKMSCSQVTDSGISCSSQEMQSQDIAVGIHCASILERLYNRHEVGDLVICGGIDVVDGTGNDKVEDKTCNEGDTSQVETRTDKDSARTAVGGNESPATVVGEERDSGKVSYGVKRPAGESCSSLQSSSILDESMMAGTSGVKQSVLASSESFSRETKPSQRSDVAVSTGQSLVGLGDPDRTRACGICYGQPKNATFVHRSTGHTFSCYSCALKVWKAKKRCPVCNLKISSVIKNYIV